MKSYLNHVLGFDAQGLVHPLVNGELAQFLLSVHHRVLVRGKAADSRRVIRLPRRPPVYFYQYA
ncbi:hypothetical protein LGZ99_17615 [Photorhabdus temperata]|nr:hypothetical protein [Photorhabdus temperata]MCT8348955.1 hypothetical protein [Photorhabdus temperata]